jgi:glycosyltransferase involved in cell wall biosynthesis
MNGQEPSRTAQAVPAVSVVVPCYNGGAFIDRLLASLAEQTFQDFETIIVDDGSGEETRAKLATLDPSIRVVRQENRGLSAARNTGFRAARADLVLPFDCDDALEPDFLEQTVALMRASPPRVGFVFTHERLVGSRSGINQIYFNPFDQLFVNRLSYCMLLRKAAWERVGGYDESMRDGYEDWEFNIRLVAAGWQGRQIDKPLTIYTVSDSGMLMSRSSRLHGRLWRMIRQRHRDLYRPLALLRLWRQTGGLPGEITLARAFGLLTLANVLPEAWFSALIHRIRVARGRKASNPA